MSDQENDGHKGVAGGKDTPTTSGARALFGHKSGAKPWEPATTAASPSQPPKQEPAASAPYPRDAQYAPRPLSKADGDRSAPAPKASIFGEVDDEGELTRLHPNYKLLMRLVAILAGFVVAVASLIGDAALRNEGLPIPFGVITGFGVLIALFIIIRIPLARYNARGYQISRDRLRVVRGILFHSDTIVPFGRVQHIDVDQGPIERALDIATMTLHTAGSHNASVRLPGLGHRLAIEMREEIRAHIKRESM